MTDIFREVDEELRREQFRKIWSQYGVLIIAVAVLIVVGVGGWRGYEWYQAKQGAEAGAAFEAAAQLAEQGKPQEAEAAFAKVAQEGTPAYRALARLREANETAQRDPAAAVALYDAVANASGTNPVMQDAAALRAGLLTVDTAGYADLAKRLEPLTAPSRAFRHSARLLLALSAWRAGDNAARERWTKMILSDPETPTGTRGQAEMLTTLSLPDRKDKDGPA